MRDRKQKKIKLVQVGRKKLTPSIPAKRQRRLLGFLPLTFFLAQAIHYWQINEMGQVLWMCNIGNLLLAIGLFLENALLIRVAVMWAVPGLVVWSLYVVPTWGMVLSGKASAWELFGVLASSLAHLGGISVGLVVLRRIRMERRTAWLYAFAWYFIVQFVSRLVTPVAMNVNLSKKIQDGWEQSFTSYWKFWLLLTLWVGVSLWMLGHLLSMLWPVTRASKDVESAT